MATQWISPTWRMPTDTESPAGTGNNQSKFDNYSLEFNGTDEFIDLGSDETLEITSDFSISVWIKDSGSLNRGIICCGDRNNGSGWHIYRTSTNKVAFNLYTANGRTATSTTSINTGNWVNVIATFEKNGTANEQIKIYVNNTPEGTSGWASAQTPTYSGTIYKQIAYPYAGSNEFLGNISTPVIFNYLLSSDQRSYLYNSGDPQNPMAIAGQPPVAYYPLGGGSTGSAKDQSPNPNTLTVPNDAVPSATVFDFVSADGDRFVIPGSPGTGPINGLNGAMTASIWMNTTAGTVYQYVFNRDRGGGTNRDWYIWKDNFYGGGNRMMFGVFNTSNVALSIRITGSTDPQGDPIIPVNDGKWHHIVGVYDGTETIELYTDGVLQATNTSAGHGAINTTSRTAIGGINNGSLIGSGSGSFNGDLSNAQIWNTNLSSAEVVTLYNNGVPLLTGTQLEAANLKGWWKMNVDTSTWDGSDWEIGNSAASYTTAFNFDNAATTPAPSFDSSFNPDGYTKLTFSIWAYIDNYHTKNTFLASFGAAPNKYSDDNFRILTNSSTLQISMNTNSVASVNVGGAFGSITPNDVWNLITIVYDGTFTDADPATQNAGRLKFYTNGVYKAFNSHANDVPSSIVSTSSIGTRIGARNPTLTNGASRAPLYGQLSNAQIWNTNLSASDVLTLYNGGSPLSGTQPEASNIKGWWKMDTDTSTWNGSAWDITDSSGEGNTATSLGMTESNLINSFVSVSNGTSFGMTSANLVTSDLTRSIPYSSYSIAFDGTDDHIDFTEVDLGLNSTVSFWINPAVTLSSEVIIGSGGASSYFLYSQATLLYVKIGSYNDTFTHSMAANNWYNITIVRTGDSVEVFQNSTSLGTKTGYGTVNNTLFDAIGARANGNLPFEGKLSNVSGFNFALTEDQVLTIYNGGVPNSISSLSPVSWWSLAGDSYYDGTNWICPDLGSGGNNGTSANMAGTELVGNGPGSTANGIATSMDIPANLKGNAPNSTNNAFSINMTEIDRVSGSGNVPG